MAKNTQMSNTALAAEANAVAALANSGKLRIYDGTQPTDGNTAIGAQVLLVELTMNATAFATTTTGVLTANAITSGVAVATGTAAWFRLFKSDGTTALFDGTAGTGTHNIVLATTSIASGVTVSCSSFTHTIPASGTGV